ncbi:MAG: glycoside hydrolase family 1 protein [Lentisphaeria bacterium]|nr:glycoside hydrolase family 1 protein [Lentisphaeria bacterium]
MLNLHKMPEFTFPENFIWGSGSAAHQIEGDNYNNQWYHMEQNNSNPAIKEPSGKACNSWEMLDEDIALLKELGHKGYRFSVEWSRIEPENGRFDHAALARYIDFLQKLKNAGIHTCVTLLHFTHPQWFENLGGFTKEENIRYFTAFIQFIVPHLTPYTDSWTVVNEINLGSVSDIQKRKILLKAFAYGSAVVKNFSSAPVSAAHALIPCYPLRPYDDMDIAAAHLSNWVTNDYFFHAVRTGEIVLPQTDGEYVPELKNSCDFWAINYYHRRQIDSRKANLAADKFYFNNFRMCLDQAVDREFNPEVFVNAVSRLTDKPIWITENGVCTDTDEFRIIYLMLQFQAMQTAMTLHKADICAYFHWSLLDNYEWGSFDMRFGLASVDRKTFRRTPKKSAYFYKDVIRNNAVSGKLFEEHTPTIPHFDLMDMACRKTILSKETQA